MKWASSFEGGAAEEKEEVRERMEEMSVERGIGISINRLLKC